MAQKDTAHHHHLHDVVITDAVEHHARRFARIWSALALLAFVVLAATVGIPHGPDLESWERQIQITTLIVLAVAILIAWKWEGLGASIMLVGGTSLGVLATLQHQPLIAFLPAAVFVIPAIAFLVAWHRTRTFAAVVTMAAALLMVLVTGSFAAEAMYDHGYGAAHPQSHLPDLPESPVTWMWAGGITTSEAAVVARIDGETALLTLTDPTGAVTEYPGTRSTDVWRFAVAGLDPDTDYQYSFVVDNRPITTRTGSLHTFPAGPTSFTIAAGSCARLGSNGEVYETILEADPDLFLVPGDFFYADHVDTPKHFLDAYDETLTQPAQAALLAEVPVAYVWDDHDFGRNDADATIPTRDLALDAFAIYVPHYDLDTAGTINQAFTIGRVRFLMLDNRAARDPKTTADGPGKTMLGTDQLAWLKKELLAANANYPLTVIVTSVPWISTPSEGSDDWGGYAAERRDLADFIAANQIGGLLMIAGDAHMVAIDDGTNADYSAVGNATFPLLHAAALDRPGSVKGGPYSEGAYPGGGQFGLIEVTDTGTADIEVRLAGLDWRGDVLVEYSFEVAAPVVSP